MTLLIAILLALSLVGCSFFMSTNPEGWEPSQEPSCSERQAALVVDTVMALAGVVGVAMGLECYSTNQMFCGILLGPGVVTALLWGGGALVGQRRIDACRKSKRQHDEWEPEELGRKAEDKRRAFEEFRKANDEARRKEQTRCREIIDNWRKEPAGSKELQWKTMSPRCRDLVPASERPSP